LVTLDSHDLQQQLTAARTLRETSRAQLRRVDELLATGVVATRDREQAQTQLAAAEAAVAAIEAQLDYAEVRAPFSGVVQARHVDQGDLAAPGRVLITLEGPEQLELVATLSLTEATGLAVGSPVRFDSESVSGAAQITALATSGDPLTHRQLLRARVTEASGPLRAGSFARIQLDRVPGADSRRPNLSVPLGVLVERGELTGVFVVEDGHATLRWIQLGARDGDRVLVRAGLSQHDQVIANPASLRDGQPVEVER
jgi:RND family efflux transporter MFP subunit